MLRRQGRRHGFEGGHHHRSELRAEDVLVSQGGVLDIHLEGQNFLEILLEIFWGCFLMVCWVENVLKLVENNFG